MIKVIKRDGRVKEFDVNRIIAAIHKAQLEVKGIQDDLGEFIADSVNCDLLVRNIKSIDIEEIQDLVIKFLQEEDKAIADAYQEYRNVRSAKRSSNGHLTKSILGIINCSNEEVLKENSNKQASSVATQRDLLAGEVSKDVVRNTILPAHLVKAHDECKFHWHDMDYSISPMFNCCLVDLEDMLQNGTVINDKLVESPKSFATACTVATQIMAQIASHQYGQFLPL